MKKIRKFINYIKYYYSIISDFISLNKYVFYSSIFLNRLEKLLHSDLEQDVILRNIELAYSDFKIDYTDDCFEEGIYVENKFNKEEVYD